MGTSVNSFDGQNRQSPIAGFRKRGLANGVSPRFFSEEENGKQRKETEKNGKNGKKWKKTERKQGEHGKNGKKRKWEATPFRRPLLRDPDNLSNSIMGSFGKRSLQRNFANFREMSAIFQRISAPFPDAIDSNRTYFSSSASGGSLHGGASLKVEKAQFAA